MAAKRVGPCGCAPAFHRGCSSLGPLLEAILQVPLPERELRSLRYLALPTPGVQPVVQHEPGQVFKARARGTHSRAIQLRAGQQLARDLHRLLLDHRKLVALADHLPPLVDLLVDVDLDRADTRAATVQGRSKGQRAVFAQVEGRVDDYADGSG